MELIKKYGFVAVLILIVAGTGYFLFSPVSTNSEAKPTPAKVVANATPTPQTQQPNSKTMEKPKMQIDAKKQYEAVLHTSEGDITISFDTKNTPITSNNFLALAKNKFYDNTIFHRVMDGFMIQGGDPEGTGMGGPGYKFDDEYLKGSYTRGTIAMANSGPDTNGSQFFIMHKDYALPNAYVIFGKVTKGIETVDKIATAETSAAFGGEKSKPTKPVKITSIEISEK